MKTLTFLLAVCALASGCIHPHRGHVVPHNQSRRVHHVYDTSHDPGYVEVHVHTHDCGHNVVLPINQHGGPHGRAPRVHVHGENCGHVLVHGEWLPPGQAKKHHDAEREHPHGGPSGQAKKVHVHGDKCGHVLVDGEWVAPGRAKKKKKD